MTVNRGPGVRQIGAIGTTPKEHRLAIAGQYGENAPGVPRSGLLAQAAVNVVAPTASMSYNVAPVAAVIARTVGEGVYTPTTSGTTTVPTGAAPATGSCWDLIWIKQNDQEKGDANNDAILGVTSGAAAATPSRPTGSVPDGALVIAEAQIFSGTASTTQSPNTVTQVFQITAARGATIPVRSVAERDLITAPAAGQAVSRLDAAGAPLEIWDGSMWSSGAVSTDIPWTAVPLMNSFAHYTEVNKWNGLRYRLKGGVVYINGPVKKTTSWVANTVCGTIPTALRPDWRMKGIGVEVDNSTGYLILLSAGAANGVEAISTSYPIG